MSDIRRREFIAALGAARACPLTARAQQGERMRRIGILMPYPPTNAEMQVRVRAFREELRKRGWAASVNAQFDERWTSDNMDLIRAAAANLVELNPDVILAVGARVVPILMELTAQFRLSPQWLRAHRTGLRGKPRSPRWQRNRLCDIRVLGHRQDAADAQRDCAQRYTRFYDL